MQFYASMPHPDEELLALKIYAREIEESGIYTKIAQEITNDWRAEREVPDDTPNRVRLYSK
jgi:hypothetical protein